MTILELREKRAKAWEAAKAFLDSHRNDKGMDGTEEYIACDGDCENCPHADTCEESEVF